MLKFPVLVFLGYRRHSGGRYHGLTLGPARLEELRFDVSVLGRINVPRQLAKLLESACERGLPLSILSAHDLRRSVLNLTLSFLTGLHEHSQIFIDSGLLFDDFLRAQTRFLQGQFVDGLIVACHLSIALFLQLTNLF